MRRLLMVFLMLILPLQWSAAAVAAYCEHETEVNAQQHPGHHQHEHHEQAALETQADGSDKADFDADCPTCHFLATIAIFTSDGLAALPPMPQSIASYVATLTDRYLDTPFRPPLAILA